MREKTNGRCRLPKYCLQIAHFGRTSPRLVTSVPQVATSEAHDCLIRHHPNLQCLDIMCKGVWLLDSVAFLVGQAEQFDTRINFYQSAYCLQASFNFDFMASKAGRNRIIEILSQALEECQRRFMNPFQRFSFSRVRLTCTQHHCRCILSRTSIYTIRRAHSIGLNHLLTKL